MAKLLIQTQTHENYGDDVNPHWKPKGGCDYVVKNINVNKVTETLMGVRGQIECDNEWYRESIIDFSVVADDALTEFEQSQLAYEGKIRYGSKEITW
jgi:hypothetical protein